MEMNDQIKIDHIYQDEEIEQLKETLFTEFKQGIGYDVSRLWVSKIERDILKAHKAKIAAWDIKNNRLLVGICILSKSELFYDPELEIELIYVSETYRRSHHRYKVGSKLLEKVESLCAKYNYNRIVSWVPKHKISLIDFYLNKNFEIIFYDERQNRYLLAKNVNKIYNKDPFDIRFILDWLKCKWHIQEFNWPTNETGHGIINNIGHWKIEFDIFITDYKGISKAIENAKNQLKMIILKQDEPETKLKKYQDGNTYILTPSKLKEETGNHEIIINEDIIGLTVSIRNEWFQKFKIGAMHVFVDGSEYGKILRRIPGVQNPYIFFTDHEELDRRIIGIGVIYEIESNTPENIWKKYGKLVTFTELEKFKEYVNIKTTMTAIKFQFIYNSVCETDSFEGVLANRDWIYFDKTKLHQLSTDLKKSYPKIEL